MASACSTWCRCRRAPLLGGRTGGIRRLGMVLRLLLQLACFGLPSVRLGLSTVGDGLLLLRSFEVAVRLDAPLLGLDARALAGDLLPAPQDDEQNGDDRDDQDGEDDDGGGAHGLCSRCSPQRGSLTPPVSAVWPVPHGG